MAVKFTTTKASARSNGVKVLVYGRAGTGKTRLIATAPTPLIISAEGGLLSLDDEDLPDIPVIEIKTMDDLNDAYHWLTTNKKAAKFETICLDSISEIGEVILSAAKANSKDGRQAYGELIDEMLKLIKKFRDLKGKHVYFTAKEAKIVDSETNTTTYEPNMPGAKLGDDMPYYFDEVFNLNTKKDPKNKNRKIHFLRTEDNFQYRAKDRSGSLNDTEPADLGLIFDKITSGKKAAKYKE